MRTRLGANVVSSGVRSSSPLDDDERELSGSASKSVIVRLDVIATSGTFRSAWSAACTGRCLDLERALPPL